MRFTIHFNNQLCLCTIEIHNKFPNAVLPSEL